jgi:hypothetical protein
VRQLAKDARRRRQGIAHTCSAGVRPNLKPLMVPKGPEAAMWNVSLRMLVRFRRASSSVTYTYLRTTPRPQLFNTRLGASIYLFIRNHCRLSTALYIHRLFSCTPHVHAIALRDKVVDLPLELVQ